MSQTTFRIQFIVDNVLTDATTATLSDAAAVFGIKRTDDDAVVVAAGTALTRESLGCYKHTFTDPADDLTYEVASNFVFDGKTTIIRDNITGGSSANTNLYDLSPRVQTNVRGQLDVPYLRQTLRKSALEFIMESGIWEEELASIVSVADQTTYTMVFSHDAFIHEVVKVRIDDDSDGDDQIRWNIEEVDVTGTIIRLIPVIGDAGKDINITVRFVPKETNTQLPSHILDRWGHAIVYLSVASMKEQQPWRDPNGAAYWNSLYREALGKAKIETRRERGPGNLKIRPRLFV